MIQDKTKEQKKYKNENTGYGGELYKQLEKDREQSS